MGNVAVEFTGGRNFKVGSIKGLNSEDKFFFPYFTPAFHGIIPILWRASVVVTRWLMSLRPERERRSLLSTHANVMMFMFIALASVTCPPLNQLL